MSWPEQGRGPTRLYSTNSIWAKPKSLLLANCFSATGDLSFIQIG
jgi:hypothetical protein